MGGDLLISDTFPTPEKGFDDGAFETVRKCGFKIRSMRKNAGVDPTRKITAILSGEAEGVVQRNADIISFLARLDSLQYGDHNQQEGAKRSSAGTSYLLAKFGND